MRDLEIRGMVHVTGGGFYDNIPLLSWLLLRAKCRQCHTRISARYFLVELLTGSVFLGLYLVYFHTGLRPGMQVEGGWFVYLIYLVLLAAFIAFSTFLASNSRLGAI